MTDDQAALTGDSTIGAWLANPAGAEIIAGIAAQGQIDDASLQRLRNLPLARMLNAAGPLPEGTIEAFVAQANGGTPPGSTPVIGQAWVEKITTGRFTGQTVIVTGAASGIGRAVASRVAREGGRVIAVDISEQQLTELATAFPEQVTPVAADITTEDGVTRVIDAAGDRIDGLANVAGVMDDFAPLHEVADPVLERVFNVNVFGLIRLSRAVLPSMIDARSGSIVNVASEAALRGSSAGLAYTASKSAVVGITRNTAFMYADHGIRVNAVAPGGTLTGMRPTNTNPFGQDRVSTNAANVPIALPEALAASITFLLSDDGINITGAILPSDGGESVY